MSDKKPTPPKYGRTYGGARGAYREPKRDPAMIPWDDRASRTPRDKYGRLLRNRTEDTNDGLERRGP